MRSGDDAVEPQNMLLNCGLILDSGACRRTELGGRGGLLLVVVRVGERVWHPANQFNEVKTPTCCFITEKIEEEKLVLGMGISISQI